MLRHPFPHARAAPERMSYASSVGVTCLAPDLPTGNPETQHQWHEAYRDMMQNMYRTSYKDMIHGREVSVKNDMPAGYGGHVPSLRHDVLFRNTAFDRKHASLRTDMGRDTLPSFEEQNLGIPAVTKLPRGKRKPPTAGTVPNVLVKPPWALTMSLQEPPNFRTTPNSLSGSMSARSSARGVSGLSLQKRPNTVAVSVGQQLASPGEFDSSIPKSAESRLRFDLREANASANERRLPTEEEVLLKTIENRPLTSR